MSEYCEKESNLQFAGSDKVYKNAQRGIVTSFVDKNPKCILLFDEVEKAHLNVIHLFLQMCASRWLNIITFPLAKREHNAAGKSAAPVSGLISRESAFTQVHTAFR